MAPIVAEFSYWYYGEFSRSAMIPRPEIRIQDIEMLASRYVVKVDVHEAPSLFLSAGRGGRYRKIVLKIMGDSADEIRSCARDIILRYGRPDEIPFAFSSDKRAGRAILESLLQDYPRG
jgi:hypothetical protein